jgi:uncharacterized damage-inducible protein DinB
VTIDRAALREMFDYTTFTSASYANSVRHLPEDAFCRAVDGSGWPSLRDALFHIASAWDGWIVEASGSPHAIVERSDITSWDDVERCRAAMRGRLESVIDRTPDDRLYAPSWPIVPAGEPEMSPAHAIAHILLHERGHHGDVSTLLSALGAPVPGIDYMTYVFFRNRKSHG